MIPNLQAPIVLLGLVFTALSNALDPCLIIDISSPLFKQPTNSWTLGKIHLHTQSTTVSSRVCTESKTDTQALCQATDFIQRASF